MVVDRDEIVPYEQAKKALAAIPSAKKDLVTIRGAGHNDLLMSGAKQVIDWWLLNLYSDAATDSAVLMNLSWIGSQYFDALGSFVAGLVPLTALTAEDVGSMSVKELKAAGAARGVDFTGCAIRLNASNAPVSHHSQFANHISYMYVSGVLKKVRCDQS